MNDKIYVVGSLRNPRVPEIAAALRADGWDAFDEWYASGPETDDYWQRYEQQRSRPFHEAIRSPYAQNCFEFDRKHIDESAAVVLVMPAGKSAFLELGYAIGSGKPGFIALDGEPERYEMMFQFATGIVTGVPDLLELLRIQVGNNCNPKYTSSLTIPTGQRPIDQPSTPSVSF